MPQGSSHAPGRPHHVVVIVDEGTNPFEVGVATELFGLPRPELGLAHPLYKLTQGAGEGAGEGLSRVVRGSAFVQASVLPGIPRFYPSVRAVEGPRGPAAVHEQSPSAVPQQSLSGAGGASPSIRSFSAGNCSRVVPTFAGSNSTVRTSSPEPASASTSPHGSTTIE